MITTQKNYTRFVIIGSHRSGSNYLSSLLSSHPDIISIGEVFNQSILFAKPGKPHLERNIFIKAARDASPVWFLRHFIYHDYSPQIKAVGFRYFYLHAEGKFRSILEYLKNDKNIRIIHLKRKNLLRSYWSLRKAQETGIWTVQSVSPIVQPAIHLTLHPNDCASYFTSMETYIKTFDAHFSRHKTIEVEYESLCRNLDHEQSRILSFLEVSPHKLSASTKKLGVVPLRTVISNFFELKSHFKATRWQWFFEESDAREGDKRPTEQKG